MPQYSEPCPAARFELQARQACRAARRYAAHVSSGTLDLFATGGPEPLAEGAVVLRGFALAQAAAIWAAVQAVIEHAPLRNMLTPGGQRMSVQMTNCGAAGWISDGRGYRYAPRDPLTDADWPPLPAKLRKLAETAAAAGGFDRFAPDVCLVNCYVPGTRLSLHQDKDERDLGAPIVSVSLGLAAIFQFGGPRRADRPVRVPLEHGDVVVWGGPARLRYHGVLPLADGEHPLTGPRRFNLTFRKAL